MVDIINSLQSAADAYIKCAPDDPLKGDLFTAVVEWIAASYEEDRDYTEEQLEQMDFESAARDYIERRRKGECRLRDGEVVSLVIGGILFLAETLGLNGWL